MHLTNFQAAVTNARDFKTAELKANHAQAINLVMNGLSELNSKLKQFSDSINQKLEGYLADNCTIYQPPQQCNNLETANHPQNQLHLLSPPNQSWQQETCICHYCGKQEHLRVDSNSTHHLSPAAPTHLLATVSGNLSAPTNSNTIAELTSKQNPKAETDTAKLKIVDATITNNKSLAAIFPFEFEETTPVLLFSEATLDTKLITVMYTNVKIDGHAIKLILNNRSAGSIITQQLMNQLGCQVDCAVSACIITTNRTTKTPIGEIDNFSFEVNNIIIPIKVLEMTGYLKPMPYLSGQCRSSNLAKMANTRKYLPHVNTSNLSPHHQPYLSNSRKKKKPIWEEKVKKKEKDPTPTTTYNHYTYTILQRSTYCQPKLICINCSKKLLSMGACYGDDEEYLTATKFYCCECIIECFEHPKWQKKWDNKFCLACGETLHDKGICCLKTSSQMLEWLALPEEIRTIKNNLSEPIELDWNPEPVINLLDPEQFYKHYQELAPTREKQKQQLEEINTRLCDYCLILYDF
ncbi:hypothetical protein G9A89_001325 [Geosiphon pyriformis]|nr:hypothetical protein G9A89_001325 [Geosiphon pyriformis]